ncbi:MAG: S41 family peptidase [Candidatus Omnitrophica bacterium]|nr:S41 family peptidase [Candidatus Omnitrophota bacterium]
MKTLSRFVLVSSLLVVCCLSITLGVQKTVYAVDHLRNSDEEMRQLVTVYDEVLKNYVEIKDASPADLMEGAIVGMLQTLDPYSQYFPPAEYKKFNEATQGEFGGLGIRIILARPDARWLPGWLTVVEPIKDTPATRCKATLEGKEFVGLKPDDKIVKIGKDPTRTMSLESAVDKLKGPPGTTVTIQIARKPTEGNPVLLDFVIERAIITVPPVDDKDIRMIDDDIGYIWLKDFTSHAHEVMEKAISDLKGQGMKALIFDLRDNTGGLLPVAIEICEKFIKKGEEILFVDSRNDQGDETHWSRKEPVTDVPMIVLINQNSASASEIVAGCIQDHKRGLIVGPEPGVTTYGKGSVQTVIKLDDGSGLKLTTALWYTPNRQKIHGHGIKPDAWSDMSVDYWLNLRQAEKVGFLKPKMLRSQHANETEEKNSEVTVEELLGKTSQSDAEKDLYDKQLFFAAQLLHAELEEQTVKKTPATADAR